MFFQISRKLLKIFSCYILNFYELYKHIFWKNITNREIFQYKNFTIFPKIRQKQCFSPLCSTQYSSLPVNSPLHFSRRCTRRPFKKSYFKKKHKATTMVFVENTSYQGYFMVKSLVWVSFIKRIVSVKLDIWRFLLTKPVYRWLNWSPTEQPKNLYCTSCHSNNQNTTITEAKKQI